MGQHFNVIDFEEGRHNQVSPLFCLCSLSLMEL